MEPTARSISTNAKTVRASMAGHALTASMDSLVPVQVDGLDQHAKRRTCSLDLVYRQLNQFKSYRGQTAWEEPDC